jgi:hypothetical protein
LVGLPFARRPLPTLFCSKSPLSEINVTCDNGVQPRLPWTRRFEVVRLLEYWRACLDLQRMSHLKWLEADGLGGFACGTVAGIRLCRCHAPFLIAMAPPTNRTVLVNGYDAWVETPSDVLTDHADRPLPHTLRRAKGRR